MKKFVFGSLAVAAVAGLALGVAHAQSRGAGMMGGMERPTFEELDSDGDGVITIAEMKARAAARFAESDADGDGNLTVEELSAAVAARAAERARPGLERMIEWRDADGDGALSLGEIGNEDGPRMFNWLDADDDGTVSAEEFKAMQDRMEQRRAGRFGGDDAMRGPGRAGSGDRHGMFGHHHDDGHGMMRDDR